MSQPDDQEHHSDKALPLILIDVDNGAESGREALEGAAHISLDLPCELVLVGDEREITSQLQSIAHDAERLRVADSTQMSFKKGAGNKAGTIAAGMKLAGSFKDRPVTFISGGHPADILRSAKKHLDPLSHVKNPALAAVLPTIHSHGAAKDPFALLLDIGATPSPSMSDLIAFAAMGTAYARLVTDNPRPRLGLLSNSTTMERTHPHLQRVAAKLEEIGGDAWEFIGPVRSDFVLLGDVDVLLAEGQSGEILSHSLDGFKSVGERLIQTAGQRLHWRMAIGLLSAGLDMLRELADQENYGGAPLLGFRQAVITCEQDAQRKTYFNAAKLALKSHRLELQRELIKSINRLHQR